MIRHLLVLCLAILLAGSTAYSRPRGGFAGSTPPPTDPTSGLIAAYNDAYTNWSIAGLVKVGGIPTRSTVCATVNPTGITNPPQANDDVVKINAAIASCTAGQVVQFASGTYTFSQTETVLLNKGVTIRGNGSCTNGSFPYCNTLVDVYDGAVIYVVGGGCAVNSAGPATSGCSGLPPFLMAHQQFNNWWSGCSYNVQNCPAAIELTADAAQGDTTISVASTTNLSVGQWVLIDEASGAGWLTDPITAEGGQVWGASDALNSSGSPARGNVIWQKHNPTIAFVDDYGTNIYPYQSGTLACDWTFCDRPTEEIKLITAVGTGTVTFDTPLTTAFRRSGSITFNGAISGSTMTTTSDSCQLAVGQLVDTATQATAVPNGMYISAVTSCSGGVGVYTVTASGLTVTSRAMIGAAHQARVYYQTNGSGTTPIPFISGASIENISMQRPGGACVQMVNTVYSWLKNIDCKYWFQGAIKVIASARDQVTSSFAENGADNENSGVEYAFDQESGTTEALFDNNISLLGGKAMVSRAAGAGSVIAHNYFDQTYYLTQDISPGWIEIGVNGSHLGTPHEILFEGNWGPNLDSDNTHGATQYVTYYRNWGTGYRSTFTDPQTSQVVNDVAGTVGGSAGSNGPLRGYGPMGYSYWFAMVGNVFGTPGQSTTANGWQALCSSNKCIDYAGWANWASSGGSYFTDVNLATLSSTAYILRHANYDTVSGGVTYATGFSHTLVNSFYAAAAPSYFSAGAACSYAWPWVTPQSSPVVQAASGAGSCSTYSGLPAKARIDAGTPFVQP